MYQPFRRHDRGLPAASDARWESILVAWTAFVVVPLAVMVAVSHPLLGIGVVIGVALPSVIRTARRRLRGADGLATGPRQGPSTPGRSATGPVRSSRTDGGRP